ncbi:MAG: hypothetical protein IJ882_03610, partial [Paludibacteraceae bacterium]|nr:hypothetical protein [Paludibacteraceae bacterium]
SPQIKICGDPKGAFSATLRVKAFKRPPSGHIKKFFISQKLTTIIQKFELLIKSKKVIDL